MTIIVIRGLDIVADSMVSQNAVRSGYVSKLRELPMPHRHERLREYIAAFGNTGLATQSMRQVISNRTCKHGLETVPPLPDAIGGGDFGLVVLHHDGEVSVYEDGWFELYPAPFYAFGCGREIALGALEAGASAKEAVMITINNHGMCGGPIAEGRAGDMSEPKMWDGKDA